MCCALCSKLIFHVQENDIYAHTVLRTTAPPPFAPPPNAKLVSLNNVFGTGQNSETYIKTFLRTTLKYLYGISPQKCTYSTVFLSGATDAPSSPYVSPSKLGAVTFILRVRAKLELACSKMQIFYVYVHVASLKN